MQLAQGSLNPVAAICPDVDFDAFLARFESSEDVQGASTANPLTINSIDSGADPEPRRITEQIALEAVDFPVMLGPTRREAAGLRSTVARLGRSEREVAHAVPDSDAQVRSAFRADPCWKLTAISSDAL